MIDLVNHTGRKTDLVTVGGVALCRRRYDLALGQFSGHSLRYGNGRIGRARYAHCRVDVGTSGEGIADRTADTGGGAAERLDLRRVVVRFVFEEKQPVLVLAVVIYGDLDGAGVDLFALVEFCEFAFFFEHLRADRSDVHEIHGLRSAKRLSRIEIALPSSLGGGVLEFHAVDRREECRMAAVIAPVGVDHADLGDGGIASLIFEIRLAERRVVHVHRKAVLFYKSAKTVPVKRGKAVKNGNVRGDGVFLNEGFFFGEGRFACLDRIDYVLLDRGEICLGDLARENVHLRRSDERTVSLREELYALGGGVSSLVELTGQKFHCENGVAVLHGERFGHNIKLRLGENGRAAFLKQLGGDSLHVVAVENAYVRYGVDHEERTNVLTECMCLVCKLRLLFNEYSVNHKILPITVRQ